jgi:carbon monoxide dehydrogenase subunit G
LSPEGITDVSYEGEVHLGGTIASIGQRLVDTTSKMLLKRFFSKLSEIARSPSAEASSG